MARDRPTKNQIRASLRKKKKAGLLPPQECPAERCKASLADPTLPEEYALYREMFSLAREVPIDKDGTHVWQCPACGYTWGKHHRLIDAKR